jgi:hypothetical protein
MCDSATLGLIQEVVDQKVNRNEMFTAFDVSLAVKELAQQRGIASERHRHMKNAIHQELEQYTQSGVYSRQLHNVGAATPAFLYYPAGADPSQYVPRQASAPQASAPQASAPPSVAAAVASQSTMGLSSLNGDANDGDQSDKGRKPDARGTLTVPNFLLRAAGFAPKDVAYVMHRDDNGTPVLVLSKRPLASPLTTYTVDYASNVRITATTLSSAGIGGTNETYDFCGTGDEVVVRKHV